MAWHRINLKAKIVSIFVIGKKKKKNNEGEGELKKVTIYFKTVTKFIGIVWPYDNNLHGISRHQIYVKIFEEEVKEGMFCLPNLHLRQPNCISSSIQV